MAFEKQVYLIDLDALSNSFQLVRFMDKIFSSKHLMKIGKIIKNIA